MRNITKQGDDKMQKTIREWRLIKGQRLLQRDGDFIENACLLLLQEHQRGDGNIYGVVIVPSIDNVPRVVYEQGGRLVVNQLKHNNSVKAGEIVKVELEQM